MGFDQYHEPPEELSRRDAHVRADDRVAHRGGGGDRLVRATSRRRARREAKAIMQNAQEEEFKHFGMDLEFLLRRKPKWRAALHEILFTEGDIVEAGEKGEHAEDDA